MFHSIVRTPHNRAVISFRGTVTPRAGDFAFLAEEGIDLRKEAPAQSEKWAIQLHHRQWGSGRLAAPRTALPVPPDVIDWDPYLTQDERTVAKQAGCEVHLTVESSTGDILRDKKLMLRFGRTIMGADGLSVVDLSNLRFWSREALEEELAHDADLDIEALYAVHLIASEGQKPQWLHTHGLGDVGGFDFDILRPSPDLSSVNGSDLLRAIAFAIIEGKVSVNTPRFRVASPEGEVRFVEVTAFNRKGDPEAVQLRDTQDETHNRNRAVLCEPSGGLFGRWSKRLKPSRFLAQEMKDRMLIHFSDTATSLMAERARMTYPTLRQVLEEFADLELPALVKIGYRTDRGQSDNDREHLWLQVHKCLDGQVDATLLNEPFDIARMTAGTRAMHAIEGLSDWQILTPAGPVNPRYMHALRALRARGAGGDSANSR